MSYHPPSMQNAEGQIDFAPSRMTGKSDSFALLSEAISVFHQHQSSNDESSDSSYEVRKSKNI